jgi:hypothetical protein
MGVGGMTAACAALPPSSAQERNGQPAASEPKTGACSSSRHWWQNDWSCGRSRRRRCRWCRGCSRSRKVAHTIHWVFVPYSEEQAVGWIDSTAEHFAQGTSVEFGIQLNREERPPARHWNSALPFDRDGPRSLRVRLLLISSASIYAKNFLRLGPFLSNPLCEDRGHECKYRRRNKQARMARIGTKQAATIVM